jgi:hypothetical protein
LYDKNRIIAKNYNLFQAEMAKFVGRVHKNKMQKAMDIKKLNLDEKNAHFKKIVMYSSEFDQRSEENISRVLIYAIKTVFQRIWVTTIKNLLKIRHLKDSLVRINKYRERHSTRVAAAILMSHLFKKYALNERTRLIPAPWRPSLFEYTTCEGQHSLGIGLEEMKVRTPKVKEKWIKVLLTMAEKKLERTRKCLEIAAQLMSGKVYAKAYGVVGEFIQKASPCIIMLGKFNRAKFLVGKVTRRIR